MTTLLEMRQTISSAKIDDALFSVVTALSPVGEITCASLNAYPAGHFNGWEITIGTQSRTITNHAVGAVFTLNQVFSAFPPAASVELHKIFTVAKYNSAIAQACMELRKRTLVPITDSSLTMVEGQEEYAIPASFYTIHRLMYIDTTNEKVAVANSAWELLPSRILRIATPVNAYKIFIVGTRLANVPVLDTDTIEGDEQFIQAKACAILLASEAGGPQTDADNDAQRGVFFETVAGQRKREVPRILPPNSRMVV